jgi:hypothetical protein
MLETGAQAVKPKDQYLVTRRFNVNIRGSLAQFAGNGQEAATWAPINGKVGDVFGISDIFESTPDVGTTAAVLANSVLHRVTVLETKNDFPLNLGVTMACVPSEETTKTGHKYALTTIASTHQPNPTVVFEAEASSNEGITWRSKFPTYNTNNLESEGVLQVSGQPYLFVSQSHPVVELLRDNAEHLNADISEQPLIDGEWYKITKQVMSTCCGTLRTKVLNKVSTRDLNNFSVQIHRIGNKDWNNITSNDELVSAIPNEVMSKPDNQEEIARHLAGLMKRQFSWTARLELQYEVHV